MLQSAEKNRRDHAGRYPDGQRPQPAPAHEPGHARGQRRPDQSVPFERACWYAKFPHTHAELQRDANEALVLQAIKLRYLQKEIYTYSGIVLIATNPFARVDSLYVPGMVQVYAGKQRSYGAPHLFAIAEEAFA